MTDRVIDIAGEPARLKVRHDQLVIERENAPEATAPLSEIAALVVSNPQVSFSHAVLSGLAKNGAAFIVCDEKHMPIGLMMPTVNNYVQSERISAQAEAGLPLKKRLWQQVVAAKIKAQAQVLLFLYKSEPGLLELSKRVKSGDQGNLESQAARRYWPALFADPEFKRDREKKDQNRNLNYGYAILRATVARAVCAAGLHPSLGLYHHNRYDAYCLADDLMEPFRALVDVAVVEWVKEHGTEAPFEKEAKRHLLEALTAKYEADGEQRTLFDISSRLASSLGQVYMGKRVRLLLPEILGRGDTPVSP